MRIVAERRCDGLAVFVKEENKRLGGPFEVDIFNNMTLEECQTMCVRAEKYVFCNAVYIGRALPEHPPPPRSIETYLNHFYIDIFVVRWNSTTKQSNVFSPKKIPFHKKMT